MEADLIRQFTDYLSFELYRSPKTVAAYEEDLLAFSRTLPLSTDGSAALTAVSINDIRDWTGAMADNGATAATLRRKLQSLRAFYKFLLRRKLIEVSPLAELPLPKLRKKLPVFAKEKDLEQIIADGYADAKSEDPVSSIDAARCFRNTLIAEIIYTLGLRRAELTDLTDNDIDIHRCEIRVCGKGNKIRILPLPSVLARHIAEWQRLRDIHFPSLTAPRPLAAGPDGPLTPARIYQIVRATLEGVAASRKSPHTLRHTCATSLLNAGADINSIKELLGHASLSATQIYTHVSFEEMKRDWNKAHPRAGKRKI